METFALLRATPNLTLFRPANVGEMAAAYKYAVAKTGGPVVIAVSKSRLFTQTERADSFASAALGAYVFYETPLFVSKARRFFERKMAADDIGFLDFFGEILIQVLLFLI